MSADIVLGYLLMAAFREREGWRSETLPQARREEARLQPPLTDRKSELLRCDARRGDL